MQQFRAPDGSDPLHRRILLSIGIHGKLIISFMLLLMVAVSGSCWVFVLEAEHDMVHLIGHRVAEMSQTLAIASSGDLAKHDVPALNRLANQLLKNRDLLTIAFFNARGEPLVVACRDSKFLVEDPGIVPHVHNNELQLMQVQNKVSSVIGEYAEVIMPVHASSDQSIVSPIIGYVQLNIPEAAELRRIEETRRLAVGVGALLLLLMLPIVSLLVHGILQPIGHLVAATRRIIGGDLHTQVAINRNDMIGTLADSFNAMIRTIGRQRDDLEKANRDLEARIAERTSALETSNKRLQSEIAEKDDFLRAVSHDLNAPLRNISGMAAMLLMKHKEKLDEDVIHRLQRIQKNVELETDLISELLELSRIKTRRQRLEMIETSALVAEITQVLDGDLEEKQIRLIVDTRLPTLYGERLRLRQVFQNLIDNAIKYMGSQPIREIHVGCALRRSDVEFYVRDTGIGIDEFEINKVFNVFRRGKSSAVQAIPGKGVGLAGVKSIVETYNGAARVESRIGQGSTFFFTIDGQFVPELAGVASEPKHQTAPAGAFSGQPVES